MQLKNRYFCAVFAVSLAFLLGCGVDIKRSNAAIQNTTSADSHSLPSDLEAKKIDAEVRKLEAEIDHIRALDQNTTWWTTVLAAIGTLAGAIVGGFFTFIITRMGHRFSALQKNIEDKRADQEKQRRKQEDRLHMLKLRQEREHARELHNLHLFQDLGHDSHRARLAAAAVLLDRLRRLTGLLEDEERSPRVRADIQLIKKVLVAVLKRQNIIGSQGTIQQTRPGPEAASEAALRKYIADELVVTLGARFAPGHRPADVGNSPLGENREFQECDLTDVYWAFVDARQLDFFRSDLTKASLRGAALQKTVFYEAILCDATLCDADLRQANLMGADLRHADLRNADLRGANLQGADLGGADLSGTNFQRAVINTEALKRFSQTRWPDEFIGPMEKGIIVNQDIYRPAS